MTSIEALRKNMDYSLDFNMYAVRNPKIMEGVPKKAAIVFMTSGKSKMNEYNQKLGENVAVKEKRPVYVAVREKRTWRLVPLVVV